MLSLNESLSFFISLFSSRRYNTTHGPRRQAFIIRNAIPLARLDDHHPPRTVVLILSPDCLPSMMAVISDVICVFSPGYIVPLI
jgi:hypothetical protein